MKPFEKSTIRQLGFRVALLLLVATLASTIANAQTITLGEAVDNTSLTWTTGGDAEWFGQTSDYYYDGDAAQSGDIGDSQSSWIETTVTSPGILSFYWRVSFGYTWLKFYIDGNYETSCYSHEWKRQSFSIPSGNNHTLRWVWEPHLSGKVAFLDKVEYTPAPAIMVESPNGEETWYHRESHSIRWVSTEDVGPDVKIELYKGDTPSYTISDSTDNDGYYTWYLPVTLESGTDYRIKVTSSGSSLYDYSDNYFSINEWYQSSFGGFFILESSADYAETADHAELDVGDEAGESLTIEAWVYIRGSGTMSDILSIVNKAQSYGLYARRYYSYSAGGIVGCIGTRSVEVCEWPPYEVGWHHVAVVYDTESDEMRIYVDGEAFSDPRPFSSVIPNSDEGLEVGGGSLPGAVDEVRISDVARYTGETYTMPTSPFTCDSHARALWHFDEDEGAATFHDACGTDNALLRYSGAQAPQIYLPIVVR